MSTKSVDRAAEGTEICRKIVSSICRLINWLDSSSDMGWCTEGYVVHNVHTVHIVRIGTLKSDKIKGYIYTVQDL
jgi:hypothetical protein